MVLLINFWELEIAQQFSEWKLPFCVEFKWEMENRAYKLVWKCKEKVVVFSVTNALCLCFQDAETEVKQWKSLVSLPYPASLPRFSSSVPLNYSTLFLFLIGRSFRNLHEWRSAWVIFTVDFPLILKVLFCAFYNCSMASEPIVSSET